MTRYFDTNARPNTNNTYDLGSGTYGWKDLHLSGTANVGGLTVNSSEVLFDNTGGDFTLKLNTNATSDKNEIIMGDTGTPLAKFGVGGTANDIITGSDGQDFNIGTAGGGRAINFSTDNFASVEMKLDGGKLGIGTSSGTGSLHVTTKDSGGADVYIVAQNSTANRQAGYKVLDESGNTGGVFQYDNGGNALSIGTAIDTHFSFITNNTERMRLTSNGGLEVGDGTNYGYLKVISDDAVAGYFDRRNGSGTILQFRLDDSTVGSLNIHSSTLQIGTGNTQLAFSDADDAFFVKNEAGANRDGSHDLGKSSARFKDLYLSGGVVFGATGGNVTSKTLDDYEEGTFTPTLTPNSGSYSMNSAYNKLGYTKIGKVVVITGQLVIASSSSPTGTITLGNLPFVMANDTLRTSQTRPSIHVYASGGGAPNAGYYPAFIAFNEGLSSGTIIVTYDSNFNSTPADWFSGGSDFFVNFAYHTQE